ncbi:hypothetical protein VE26_08070 [Devosia chinhatensis]|uniref:Uncharacterized protein n=2 Tax=Devosia chinhatensis TaxID=429727 RepID=A0A0F5FLM6_9HYPH|nr:hypothetical protein VE26_08070 [Devosia chinhatensis]
MVLAIGLALGSAGGVAAAPVAGNADYVTLYDAAFSGCTVPAGSVAACEAALTAYSSRLVADNIEIEVANASFSALRIDVRAANAGNPEFQALIEALFEQLLPDSGAIAGPVTGTAPVGADPSSPGAGSPTAPTPGPGNPTPASPT